MPNYPFNRCLRAWVLACMLAALGLASAGPWMHAGSLSWVCSASGQAKLVQVSSDIDDAAGAGKVTPHTLECPNCLLGGPLTSWPAPKAYFAGPTDPAGQRRLSPSVL